MQIVGTSSYPLLAGVTRPAQPLSANVSPDVSQDLTRAAQAPATPAPSLEGPQSPSAREEADKAPGQPSRKPDSSPAQQRGEQLEIAEMVSRDREVRAHEQAHAAVGGSYAGAPSYTYSRGPDGQRYAVGGEVSIDTAAVSNDPQATLSKMEVVVRAALAPAEPSSQDRSVAAQAQAQMAQARVELAELQRDAATEKTRAEPADQAPQEQPSGLQEPTRQTQPLAIYRGFAESAISGRLIDFVA
ncbi:SprA family protein [Pseudomonas sp. SJZ079]|uniref:putative metalloprotease CJM1_0395 family protein n=1 Tax=Pseudomonas sp. SJZ079 TaxID=2572887 RepID=UPI001199D23D|nr:putative metalloprotease CJM1_0395 family protein [Pseudomonas sp. SJZ079]TWC33236.1 SprA family protein [Pseudomonas sp. SJZ079]